MTVSALCQITSHQNGQSAGQANTQRPVEGVSCWQCAILLHIYHRQRQHYRLCWSASHRAVLYRQSWQHFSSLIIYCWIKEQKPLVTRYLISQQTFNNLSIKKEIWWGEYPVSSGILMNTTTSIMWLVEGLYCWIHGTYAQGLTVSSNSTEILNLLFLTEYNFQIFITPLKFQNYGSRFFI